MKMIYPLKTLFVLFSCLFLAQQAVDAKNLVLISVDTLRKDRVGVYLDSKSLTPNMDRLAAQSVLFTEAFTVVPLTSPSMCSVMTGLPPALHGSERNGLAKNEKVLTLAAVLRGLGYDTAAFVSNWTLKAHLCGLNQGFSLYDDQMEDKRWAGLIKGETSAKAINDKAIPWLEREAKEPFFLWVHYTEPHAPYVYHESFAEDSSNRGVRGRYDTEVAFVDHHIGLFLERLDALFPADSTTVVLIADHGESLGEHNYVGHGRQVYDPMMRVPLMIRDPSLTAGQRSSILFPLIDLAKTCMDLMSLQGAAGLGGRSELPVLRGEDSPRKWIFMETHRGAAVGRADGKDDKPRDDPTHLAVYAPPWKAIYELKPKKLLLFQMQEDPGEERNLAKTEENDRAQALYELLMGWYTQQTPLKKQGRHRPLSSKDTEALRSLGYIR